MRQKGRGGGEKCSGAKKELKRWEGTYFPTGRFGRTKRGFTKKRRIAAEEA